jgi:hypothetical protein
VNCSLGSAFAQIPDIIHKLIDTRTPNLPCDKVKYAVDQVMRAAFLNVIITAIKKLGESPNVRLTSKFFALNCINS